MNTLKQCTAGSFNRKRRHSNYLCNGISKSSKLQRKRYKSDISQQNPGSKLQMNPLVLPLTLFAVASLASDRNSEAASNPTSSSIVSSSNSSSMADYHREIREAFALGEAYGEAIGAVLGKLKEAVVENVSLMKKIPSVSLNELSDSLWALKSSFDRELNHLFNMKLLFRELDRIMKVEAATLSFSELRYVFAKYARQPAAMVAVDVAILRWMNHLIRKEDLPVLAEPSIVQAVCALSLYPQIEKQCSNDILRVLEQFPRAHSHGLLEQEMPKYFPALINVMKMLDPCQVRKKVEEIAAFIYETGFELDPRKDTKYSFVGPLSRMLLEAGHGYVKSMEKSVSVEEIALWDDTLTSRLTSNNHKLHSLSCGGTDGYASNGFNLRISHDNFIIHHLKASMTDESLIWDNYRTRFATVQFKYSFNVENKWPMRLHVISQISLPAIIWDEVIACTRLEEMRELLKSLRMRQAVLTYGMTVLETSAEFHFAPHSTPCALSKLINN